VIYLNKGGIGAMKAVLLVLLGCLMASEMTFGEDLSTSSVSVSCFAPEEFQGKPLEKAMAARQANEDAFSLAKEVINSTRFFAYLYAISFVEAASAKPLSARVEMEVSREELDLDRILYLELSPGEINTECAD